MTERQNGVLQPQELGNINEELYIANSNYQEIIRELVKSNVDFDNLLMNAEIGALYIDNDLRIRKITPIMGKNTKLRLADTGRSIVRVDFMEDYHEFVRDVVTCREQGRSLEREVVREGNIWLIRMCPYYTTEGKVDGVLVILFDITKRLTATKLELQVLNNNIPGGVARMRYDGGLIIEYANDTLYKMLNLTREEMHERYRNHYEQMMFETDWEKLSRLIEKQLKKDKTIQMEYRVHVNARSDEWRMIQASLLENREDRPVLQCVITDITESKLNFLELEEQRKKLSALLQMSGDMIFEYDIQNDRMTYSQPGEGILMAEQITEQYAATISQNLFFEELKEGLRLSAALRSGTENIRVELRRIGVDQQYHWVEVVGKTIYDKNGWPERVLGKVRNIDEQKYKEEELRNQSQRDSLTGLLNHLTIRNSVEEYLKHWNDGSVGYLVICDIDDFKKVNDVNGHLFGDAVLCSFADEMRNLLPNALVGRIGGDEFLLFVRGMDREGLEEKLVALNRVMTDRFKDDTMATTISCSLGVVVIDGREKEYEVLFQWADSALYQVKIGSKSSYRIVEVQPNESPSYSYLSSNENEDSYVRKDALLQNEEDLALFAVELLENVADINSALKMICDRTCHFFDFDDMVCVEHEGKHNHLIYQWSKVDKKEYTMRMHDADIYNWEHIMRKAGGQRVCIYTEEQTRNIETEEARSVMVIFADEYRDFRASIVFADRHKDRNWQKEKGILQKLSGLIFSRLYQNKMEEQERKELDHKLNYDELTGLLLYQRFIQQAEHYLKENGTEGLYFVYFDFSNFQYLNEIYGYAEGDKVLKSMAEAMEQYEGAILSCRVTSDQFVGLIRAESSMRAAINYQEFATAFTQKMEAKYPQGNLVLVIGMYEITGKEASISAMLDCANEARKKGKDHRAFTSVVMYNEELRKQSESTRSIVANMMSAYNNGEFYVYLQPKVSLKTGKIVGAEALVRWIRQDGTRLMPDQFINIFEQNGFITKVDFCVLEQVMEYLREAIDIGEEVVPVSVNFSRRHNEFPGFVPSVIKRLERYGVPARLLEAEVPESVFIEDFTTLKANIAVLREQGLKVSIDDFGSGYSSLNILTRVSVDVVKLDKQFLRDTGEDNKSLTVVKYLVRMLKRMGYQVIAEGVETAEQVEMLKQVDCDMVQGYYYARPMPIQEFREFLKKFNQPK